MQTTVKLIACLMPLGIDCTMDLFEAKINLMNICKTNESSKPYYCFVKKCDNTYEMAVESDGHVFSGRAPSKRMARRMAAKEAVKELMFKKCGRNAVTQLVQFCADRRLMPPSFKEIISKDNTFCFECQIVIEINGNSIQLIGRGYSDSAKLAKLCSARDVLNQIEAMSHN